MKMNTGDFAKLTGVSVRTLHYYDEIGLLKPDYVDENNGYRYYSNKAFEKIEIILFYRELDFSLKTIQDIVSSPNYDIKETLKSQKNLLILKRDRLDKIIKSIECVEKGEGTMNFEVFDSKTINDYKVEVKKRWGNTQAYKENQQKTSKYSHTEWKNIYDGLNAIITEFNYALNTGVKPNDNEVFLLVEKLKSFITETQYNCTNEILLCLGEMYVADERFKKNIDKKGEGTAQFMKDAIFNYCK